MFVHNTILVTDDNVQKIIDAANVQNWTPDHLVDMLQDLTYNGGVALVLYFTVDSETGSIMNFNDVPFYDDSYKTMNHVDLEHFLELLRVQ